eukprot:gb/GECG01002880.1/.p1 GENE.gb/GECG01002880.1/~~gb/GECG01002880.1/.p1  ORF type:complete len:795 (+),score=79.26 gb/GECG01002880.1/:1-2385(+)
MAASSEEDQGLSDDIMLASLQGLDEVSSSNNAHSDNSGASVSISGTGAARKGKEEQDGKELRIPDPGEFTEPCQCVYGVLSRWFHHDSFRTMQWQIIASVLMGQDGVAVLATGSGKSLTYQFPAVFLRSVDSGSLSKLCAKGPGKCWVDIVKNNDAKRAIGGTTVVVSPLLSLMYDQVDALKRKDVKAAFLSSEQRDMTTFERTLRGEYNIVYVTPELAVSGWCNKLQQLSKEGKLGLVAIDESHCVSEWGHDFRPSYRGLGVLKGLLETSSLSTPILALTATATPVTIRDIAHNLSLASPLLHKFSVDRHNVYYSFHCRASDEIDLVKAIFCNVDSEHKGKAVPSIIYCRTKAETERLASLIRSKFRVPSEPFHAGLPVKKKHQVQDSFMKDETIVVCATIAFGMGVDKPNIRVIVHWGLPGSAEAFLQHCGRAGRDGKPSRCFLFWSQSDFSQQENLIHYGSASDVHKNAQLEKYREMVNIVTSSPIACKRQQLLKKFDEDREPATQLGVCCSGCDERIRRTTADSSGGSTSYHLPVNQDTLTEKQVTRLNKHCQYLCQAIISINCRAGLGTIIQLVMGSKSEKLSKFFSEKQLAYMDVYGKGSGISKEYWQALARFCIRLGFVESSTKSVGNYHKRNFSFTVYKVTQRGHELVKGRWTIPSDVHVPVDLSRNGNFGTVVMSGAGVSSSKRPRTSAEQQASPLKSMKPGPQPGQIMKVDILNKLYSARKQIAKAHGLKPFMVVSKGTLEELASQQPTTEKELRNVNGIFDATIKQFGTELLESIRQATNGPG